MSDTPPNACCPNPQIPQQHHDSNLPHGWKVKGRLLPNVLFKVLLGANVNADATILERSRIDFVACARNSRDDDIR